MCTCRAVPGLMQSLPLKKLRNFGGKLGAELEKLGCSTAGEVAAMPAASLAKHFGQERASSILYAVQGYSDELVQVLLSCWIWAEALPCGSLLGVEGTKLPAWVVGCDAAAGHTPCLSCEAGGHACCCPDQACSIALRSCSNRLW